MRVLHLISSGGMYGAEAVILNLSHALAENGDRSVIASFQNSSPQLHERALTQGLRSVLVECRGPVSPATLRAIRDIVRAERIDLLHAHGYKADLYAWAALRGSGVPLVSTCHTWYDNDLALRAYGVLDRRVLRRFARVVAVSAQVERELLQSGVAASRIRRIGNGIDLGPFTHTAQNRSSAVDRPVHVGLVGRLAPEKGVDLFLQAAAIVVASFPAVTFTVVGEGAERARLEQQIRDLGLENTVRLAGHRESMPEVYAAFDVLVSASRQEGLPVALLEGMASGLPVVATSVGEVPSVVVPGETGLLAPPEEPALLAEAMLQLLCDGGARLAFGQRGRTRIEQHFSASRMAAQYGQVYVEALQTVGAHG